MKEKCIKQMENDAKMAMASFSIIKK